MDNFLRNWAVANVPSLRQEHPAWSWWVLGTVLIGTFLAVIDQTVVNVALSSIMVGFGASLDTIQWVITAYMLTFAVMLPLSGWLADRFGYRTIFASALFIFTVASLLCSLAWNEGALIAFRVLQGIGGGLISPVGMAILSRTFPANKLGTALGFFSISAAASSSFGPGLGGFLVDQFGWQSIFLINLPIGALGVVAVLMVQKEFRSEKIIPFDLPGFLSIAAFLVSLLLALTSGNAAWNSDGWSSPFIIGCFGLALVSFLAFLMIEFRTEHPMVDLSLLTIWNFGIMAILIFIFGMGLMGSTFLLPLYLQTSLGYTALEAGMALVPMGLIQALVSPLTGKLVDKVNPKIPMLAGLALLVGSLYLNSFLPTVPAQWQIVLPVCLMGLGFGMFFIPLQTVAIKALPKPKMAQGTGLINLIRQVGSSFGVAMLSMILVSRGSFHNGVTGEAINSGSEAFHMAIAAANQAIGHNGAVAPSNVGSISASLILQQAHQNASVQAIDDIYLLVTLTILLCVLPILALRIQSKRSAAALAVDKPVLVGE